MAWAYYILENRIPKLVDAVKWSDWYEKAYQSRELQVAFTRVDVEVAILTTFTSLNAGVGDEDPLLFKTTIYGGDFDGMDWYWTTWREAEVGHKRIVNDYYALLKNID